MVVNLSRLYSERCMKLKASEIRELLKITRVPGMISLAGGLPDPKAFPVESLKNCIDSVFNNNVKNALQYGTTEGLPGLRIEIAKRMNEKKGIDCTKDDILITHGSQQALSILAHTLIDPGDTIIMGAPTYLGAIQAFTSFEGRCETIPLENDGIDLESLVRNIKRLKRNGIHPKFIYTVPNFQNPSGITMSDIKRQELLDIASAYDMIIVEDDPYGEIVFEGDDPKPIKSLDSKGRVIYMGTFSKILAPGFRLAWITASHELLNKFIMAKQSMDLCTNSFGQYIARCYMKSGGLDIQLAKIKNIYREKRDVMLEAIDKHFPEGVEWTKPRGGMFLWVTLPKGTNARSMFKRAVDKKVAYVIGDAFYPDGMGTNTLRLNFSYAGERYIKEGIRRLGEVIKEEIQGTSLDLDLDFRLPGI